MPMKPNWGWIAWQVGIPLGGPIFLSSLFVMFWWTLNGNFHPKWDVVLDITPWALTFYALTLIATALRELWPRYADHPALFVWLAILAGVIIVYYAFMVIVRHQNAFVPPPSVYIVTSILLVATIYVCHQANARSA
jgi:uncharacterized membrane protein